ncbi:GNAT family N-acetyltransferase [Pseudomonas sp. SJZ079]|uniref:GNAT family N-acetyltransferase n=1 Tax=Pseudomonas sp. SJZ079 TaxID=2572887 RepID=UPI0015B71A1D|nr:GNAT family N-acetyltransferase [Pseudomonas sp. SJZ079]
MNGKLVIQLARETDSVCVAKLIHSVAHYFLLNPSVAGADGFMASISQAAIAGYITDEKFSYVLGFIDTELAGVAALRDNKHIYHLFVHPDFHRQGVAYGLWQYLKTEAVKNDNVEAFTVNSSIYAVPVYSRFGFIPTAELQNKNGIQFVPMRLSAHG